MMQQLAASTTELAASSRSANKGQKEGQSRDEFATVFEQQSQGKSKPSSAPKDEVVQTQPQVKSTQSQSKNKPVVDQPVDDKPVSSVENKKADTTTDKKASDDHVEKHDSTKQVSGDNQPDNETSTEELDNEQAHNAWVELLNKIKSAADENGQPKEIDLATSEVESEGSDEQPSLLSKLIDKLFPSTADNSDASLQTGEADQPTDDTRLVETDMPKHSSAPDQDKSSELSIKDDQPDAESLDQVEQLLATLNTQTASTEEEVKAMNALANLLKALQDPSGGASADGEEVLTAENDIVASLISTEQSNDDTRPDHLFDSVDRVLAFLTSQNADRIKQAETPQIKQDLSKLSEDIKVVLALPKEQLNKMLSQLTGQSLPDAVPETKQSFIASLQAGLNEMRQQLEQGREPGLDLQAMVGKAMNEMVKSANEVSQNPVRQSLTQILEFAQMTTTSQSQTAVGAMTDQLNTATSVEATEAGKLVQPHSAAVDKNATNLQKMEGIKTLVDKVQLMVNQKSLVADIRIDPPEMGNMQIRLHLGAEQASVNFVVQNQQAKDMLDQSVPRLKEMLAERGIELGQSSVRQEKDQKGGDAEQQGSGSNGQLAEHDADIDTDEPNQSHQLHLTNGAVNGIDYFV